MPSTDPGANAQDGAMAAPSKTPVIAYVLTVLSGIIRYANHLDHTLFRKVPHPSYQKFAVAWGTHDLRHIVAQISRGLLRALALEQYLRARAKAGRDIVPTAKPQCATPEDIAAMEFTIRPKPEKERTRTEPASRTYDVHRPRVDFDDPMHVWDPSPQELRAWLRRHPIGVLLAQICADLGVTPTNTAGKTFDRIMDLLRSLDHGVGATWYFDTKDRRASRVDEQMNFPTNGWKLDAREGLGLTVFRDMLGFIFGDDLPEHPAMATPDG